MIREAFLSLVFVAFFTEAVSAESIQQERQSGPVKITLSIDPKDPLIGDTITLTIQVVAEKDVEVLMPDFGEALERFSIVDFAPRTSIDDEGRTVSKQTYRLDPPASGKNVIPPILIEYVDRREGQKPSPEDLDAYEVLTDRIVFEVQSVLPTDATVDLHPPLGELAPRPTESQSRWPWFMGVLALGACIASPFVVRAVLASRQRSRRRSAYEVAQARMNALLSQTRETPEQIDRFYVQLSDIVRRYIEDRFEMRAPELTTEEFLDSIVDSPDFSGEHQGLLREFLRQADLVKFAGIAPTDHDTNTTIEKAKRFLEETRVSQEPIAARGPAPAMEGVSS
ncbi:MAG: hypothetical protein AAGD07_16605 [Planctomycetota bacterium]